jgi:hypothetical protein
MRDVFDDIFAFLLRETLVLKEQLVSRQFLNVSVIL